MRAAVYRGRRDVRIEDVAIEPPPPGYLALRITRAAICGTDAQEFQSGPRQVRLAGTPDGGRRLGAIENGAPGGLILGHEFTGRVAELGAGVEGFALGDRVVCGAGISCGECRWCRDGRTNLCAHYATLGLQVPGGLAERVNAPAAICLPIPDVLDDDAAAIAQPQAIAIHTLNRAQVRADDTLVVLGAGGIGSLAVAAAAARGIGRVVAVDVDARRLATAAALGAHVTIDAAREDPVDALLSLTDDAGADVVIELSGAPENPARAVRMVRRGGRVVIVGMQHEPVALDLHDLTLREVELTTSNAHVCAVDLPEAIAVLGRPGVAEMVIDRVVALEDVVELGIRSLLDGSAKGKVLIDPRPEHDGKDR